MDYDEWRKRFRRRSDMTERLVHLTKSQEVSGKKIDALEVLIKILKDRKINGSENEGFIVGSRKAVCFQESTLYSLAENIHYEKEIHAYKNRYEQFGLVFYKDSIFNLGGRPAIYDRTEDAKKYLPEDKWWRIVNYDLSNYDNFIDWTHEREWRVPDNLKFELEDVSIIVGDNVDRDTLIQRCEEENIDLKRVNSIISLADILY